MAGPGDKIAAGAGGHRHLRASHADREQVIDELKVAFVHGRLDRDEFGLRVGQALESRTCAELAALTAGLPPRLVTLPPPAKAVPVRKAIPQYERTLDDRIRVQGPDHPDTLAARSNLAACYQRACRLTEAIPQYQRALADSERMLGAGDTETLITRCNLASAYYTAGRLTEVVVVLRTALTDCERYLGADHQMTQTVRANLDAAIRTWRLAQARRRARHRPKRPASRWRSTACRRAM